MRISDFTPPMVKPSVDFKVVTDAPLPPEMPFEAQTAFSLGQLLDRSVNVLNRNLGNMLKCQPAAEKMVDALLAGGAAEVLIAEFGEQVQAKRIRWQMWAQQLRQCGAVMTHCRETLPMEQRQRLDDEQKFILLDLARQPLPQVIADEFNQIISSSNDFFDKLLELIDLIKNGYLKGYEHILDAYAEFFKEFNDAITAEMKEWITGVDDGKKVELDVGALKAALNTLIAKYSPPESAAVLFPAPGKEGASREEADKWREALGLPESCLIDNGDGTFSVVMDISPLSTMLASLPAGGGKVTWDTAKFQAWQTGFNAQEERMKNMLQSFTQKYSNANSYHDNFNKTLSAHLSQYADMLKAMLNF
ncbi:IpaD/SipD/SspD family type III secretion system needle tip protein [Pseudomonas hormoni]|uniref:IpaD/SipD/SspD family type III secretion system needle tip protein n=1 Tax=Pseudomonas hormoni TaxID=3093767 RepID=A0ABX8F2J8_9PSED|nr:IpaD/SipD/SspD family type III secretion system needle tip protein [Pseudomonas hormoni]QVW25117.1 IpaD/SipD/SspD family type III secretion system needle tip protein [Pseudomonas hormoni]